MFDYLNKFNTLPKDLKAKVSGPAAFKIIADLEKKYGLELAPLVMKVMVKEIKIGSLAIYLASEFGLEKDKAEALSKELREQIFTSVAEYLGLPLDFKIPPQPPIVKKPVPSVIVPKDKVPMPSLTDNGYSLKVEMLAADLIRSANVKINPDLFIRLQNILKTYLRGVRPKLEVKTLMLKPVTEGGLGFIASTIDQLLSAADTAKGTLDKLSAPARKVDTGTINKINALQKLSARYETTYDLTKLLDTKHELSSGIDFSHEIAAPKAPVVKKLTPVAAPASVKAKLPDLSIPKIPAAPVVKKIEPIKSKPVVVSPAPPTVKEAPRNVGAKPKIEDIKQVKIMNPIDELKFMDLVNFRRLGANPEEVTQKISQRVKLMKAEDYEKGLAAITAWRQSPVYKLYLKIVTLSASRNLVIADMITELNNQHQDCLSLAEIDAIIALNKSLRF
jgi:hypothetical protein